MAKIPKLYMIVGVAFVILVALFLSFQGGIPLFIISLLFAIVFGMFIYAGHIINPIITKIFKITYIKGDYEFPPGQEVIIKRSGDKFIATRFMMINIPEREEVTTRAEEREDVYIRDVENSLSTIKAPIKISLLTCTKDIGAYRESVQAKVYEYSLRIKREMEKAEPDVIRVDKWQREKEVYENLLKRLSAGVKPMAAVMYAATVAKGVTKKEAADKVIAQGKEVKAVLSNNMNAEVVDLIGEDAELCLEWERRLPTSYKEFVELTG